MSLVSSRVNEIKMKCWVLGMFCAQVLLSDLPLVLHICVSELGKYCSGNGLLPVQHQAITWTNAGLLLIGPLGTNFSEIQIKMQLFSFTKMHLNLSAEKWWPFCPGGDELTHSGWVMHICISDKGHYWSSNGLYLFEAIVNVIATDGLVTQVARASVVMVYWAGLPGILS